MVNWCWLLNPNWCWLLYPNWLWGRCWDMDGLFNQDYLWSGFFGCMFRCFSLLLQSFKFLMGGTGWLLFHPDWCWGRSMVNWCWGRSMVNWCWLLNPNWCWLLYPSCFRCHMVTWVRYCVTRDRQGKAKTDLKYRN